MIPPDGSPAPSVANADAPRAQAGGRRFQWRSPAAGNYFTRRVRLKHPGVPHRAGAKPGLR
jgi:hypothetical protein